jgi:hypothetical protein
MRFFSKPVSPFYITAIQFADEPQTLSDISDLVKFSVIVDYSIPDQPLLYLFHQTAHIGDWIAKKDDGSIIVYQDETIKKNFLMLHEEDEPKY